MKTKKTIAAFRIYRALCKLECDKSKKPLISDDAEHSGWFAGEITAAMPKSEKPGYLERCEAFEWLEQQGAIAQADFSRCDVHEPIWRTL